MWYSYLPCASNRDRLCDCLRLIKRFRARLSSMLWCHFRIGYVVEFISFQVIDLSRQWINATIILITKQYTFTPSSKFRTASSSESFSGAINCFLEDIIVSFECLVGTNGRILSISCWKDNIFLSDFNASVNFFSETGNENLNR